MNVTFDYIEIVYGLLFVLFPLYLISRITIDDDQSQVMSKDFTSQLRGVSVLIIYFHHVARQVEGTTFFKTIFINLGIVAVGIFLFVSGYALEYQRLKRKDYLTNFFSSKLVNIIVTYVVSALTIYLISFWVLGFSDFIDFSKKLISFRLIDGRMLWFTAIIIFLYLLFYLLYRIFSEEKVPIMLLLALSGFILLAKFAGVNVHWYNTIICFYIGFLVARYKDSLYLKKLNLKVVAGMSLACLLLSFFAFQYYGVYFFQFLIPVLTSSLIYSLSSIISIDSKILKIFDVISFEFYMIHLSIVKWMLVPKAVNNFNVVLYALIISFILSYIVHTAVTAIYKRRKLCQQG